MLFQPNIYQITKNIGHCLVISNVAFEHPEGSQKDTSALIHAYSAIGFEEDQSPCGECINQDNQVRICETCQLKNKIHVYEDCTNEVITITVIASTSEMHYIVCCGQPRK